MITAELTIEPQDAGRRIDHVLAEQVVTLSRSRIQDLIKDGRVTLNGAATKANAKVRTGDQIALVEPPPVETATRAEAIGLDILFEDETLIVIDKPAGMVVHPAAGNWQGTVVNALLHHCTSLSGIGGELRPGIVHRLDKDTSGCLVAAKSDVAHHALTRQFAGREVSKIYLALASGHFSKASGTIDAPIARHPVQRKKMAVVKAPLGRAARTDWRVLREWPARGGGTGALVECTLHTGRTHQIRVHLKHLGHSILGDEVYGKRGAYPRQMLHAWKLGFQHPVTGQPLHFMAKVPQDFLEAGVTAEMVA